MAKTTRHQWNPPLKDGWGDPGTRPEWRRCTACGAHLRKERGVAGYEFIAPGATEKQVTVIPACTWPTQAERTAMGRAAAEKMQAASERRLVPEEHYVLWTTRSGQRFWDGPFTCCSMAEGYRDSLFARDDAIIITREARAPQPDGREQQHRGSASDDRK